MTDSINLTQDELAGLLEVLKHPDHQQGLEDRYLTVTAIEHRARKLTRISATISGDDPLNEWTLANPTVRVALPEPPEEFAAIPGVPKTTTRVYTLVEIDPATRTAQIDLVVHAEASPAMRWLAQLRIGDRIDIVGPRPHRTPGEGTPRVLLADSSALPAATRLLRTMPHVDETFVFAAVPEDEFAILQQEISALAEPITAFRVEPHGQYPLATAFAEFDLTTDASVWAAGEREDMREIRHRCKHHLGLLSEQTQVFGYWKYGMTNTRLDFARLRATQKGLAARRAFTDTDDFEIEL